MTTPHIMSKSIIIALAALLSTTVTQAQENTTRAEYIDRWADVAIEHMEVYGIPASITMAQAILESGSGNSRLARLANNHFGIKCGNNWEGEVIHHDDDAVGECFRSYSSAEESFADHAEFLHTRKRYEFLFNTYESDDYVNWAKGLKAAGYATSPTYAEKLIEIIESEGLYLLDRRHGRQHFNEYLAKKYDVDKHKEQETTLAEGELLKDRQAAFADAGTDPNNFRITINSHEGYNVYLINGTNYIIANEGDTYKSIGRLFGIPHYLLRKINDAPKGVEPVAGEIVYIERKALEWHGENFLHHASEGETLRAISQTYGVRLKTLCKLNNLEKNTVLSNDFNVRLR